MLGEAAVRVRLAAVGFDSVPPVARADFPSLPNRQRAT